MLILSLVINNSRVKFLASSAKEISGQIAVDNATSERKRTKYINFWKEIIINPWVIIPLFAFFLIIVFFIFGEYYDWDKKIMIEKGGQFLLSAFIAFALQFIFLYAKEKYKNDD